MYKQAIYLNLKSKHWRQKLVKRQFIYLLIGYSWYFDSNGWEILWKEACQIDLFSNGASCSWKRRKNTEMPSGKQTFQYFKGSRIPILNSTYFMVSILTVSQSLTLYTAWFKHRFWFEVLSVIASVLVIQTVNFFLS